MACAVQTTSADTSHPARKGIWVIFDESTPERPRFVARKFFAARTMVLDANEELGDTSLEAVRAMLPTGLINLGRDYSDAENVLETWA